MPLYTRIILILIGLSLGFEEDILSDGPRQGAVPGVRSTAKKEE